MDKLLRKQMDTEQDQLDPIQHVMMIRRDVLNGYDEVRQKIFRKHGVDEESYEALEEILMRELETRNGATIQNEFGIAYPVYSVARTREKTIKLGVTNWKLKRSKQ